MHPAPHIWLQQEMSLIGVSFKKESLQIGQVVSAGSFDITCIKVNGL